MLNGAYCVLVQTQKGFVLLGGSSCGNCGWRVIFSSGGQKHWSASRRFNRAYFYATKVAGTSKSWILMTLGWVDILMGGVHHAKYF